MKTAGRRESAPAWPEPHLIPQNEPLKFQHWEQQPCSCSGDAGLSGTCPSLPPAGIPAAEQRVQPRLNPFPHS